MAIERRSKQRDAILENLSSRYDHPTADELYESVREELPKISLATVYRNLRQLADEGKILVLHTETSDHFDATTSQHYHLYCKTCGRIYDLDMPEMEAITEAAAKQKEVVIDSYSLMFNGTCRECQKKNH